MFDELKNKNTEYQRDVILAKDKAVEDIAEMKSFFDWSVTVTLTNVTATNLIAEISSKYTEGQTQMEQLEGDFNLFETDYASFSEESNY